MANPTTNFGWVMPTSTDLVTDLPADFATFGQGVDTTMADLKGGTTGQVLSKATATDMDFTWVTPEIGDITAITVTSPITGGGTSGSVGIAIQDGTTAQKGAVQLTDSTSSTSTTTAATPNAVKTSYDLANGAIAKTTVTTAGDIIYRNATVPTRLGIGTAGQVLAVNSGATAPEWVTSASGGMTLINTGGTTLSGASINIASIPSTYKALKIYIINYKPATDNAYLAMQFNGDATANRHWYQGSFTAAAAKPFDSTFGAISYGQDNSATSTSIIEINIVQYANTSIWKMYESYSMENNATTATNLNMMVNMGGYNQTAAISSLTFLTNGGNLTSGTVYIYGVN